jgi:hypothetical protein
MEINVEKANIMRIYRVPLPVQITINQKKLEYVEYFDDVVSRLKK